MPDNIFELFTTDPEMQCWIWKGSVHKYGYPIYKGWFPARAIVFEKVNRPLKANERFGKPTCKNSLCINPEHQRIHKIRLTTAI